ARAESGVVRMQRDGDAVADDFQNADTAAFLEPGLGKRAADGRGVRLHEGFGDVFAALLLGQDRRQHFAYGKEFFADDGEIESADDRGGDAEFGELEQPERLLAVGDGDAVDDQVGRGP